MQTRVQLHILPTGEFLIEIDMLRHHADPLLDDTRITTDVRTSDTDHAARRLRLHREHTDDRRLPCTVRTEQPEHLAVPNREGDPGNRHFPRLFLCCVRMRKFLDEILHLNHNRFHQSQSARNWIPAIRRAFSITAITVRDVCIPSSTLI